MKPNLVLFIGGIMLKAGALKRGFTVFCRFFIEINAKLQRQCCSCKHFMMEYQYLSLACRQRRGKVVSDLLSDLQDRLSRGSGASSSGALSQPATPTLPSLGTIVGADAAPEFPKTSPPASALPVDPFSTRRPSSAALTHSPPDRGDSRPPSCNSGGSGRKSGGGVAAHLSRSSSSMHSSSSSSSASGAHLEAAAASLAKLSIETAVHATAQPATSAPAPSSSSSSVTSATGVAAVARGSGSGVSLASSSRGGFPAPPPLPDAATFLAASAAAAAAAETGHGGVIPPFDVSKLTDDEAPKKRKGEGDDGQAEACSTDSDDDDDEDDSSGRPKSHVLGFFGGKGGRVVCCNTPPHVRPHHPSNYHIQ